MEEFIPYTAEYAQAIAKTSYLAMNFLATKYWENPAAFDNLVKFNNKPISPIHRLHKLATDIFAGHLRELYRIDRPMEKDKAGFYSFARKQQAEIAPLLTASKIDFLDYAALGLNNTALGSRIALGTSTGFGVSMMTHILEHLYGKAYFNSNEAIEILRVSDMNHLEAVMTGIGLRQPEEISLARIYRKFSLLKPNEHPPIDIVQMQQFGFGNPGTGCPAGKLISADRRDNLSFITGWDLVQESAVRVLHPIAGRITKNFLTWYYSQDNSTVQRFVDYDDQLLLSGKHPELPHAHLLRVQS